MRKDHSFDAITRSKAALDAAISYQGDGSPEARRRKLAMLKDIGKGLSVISRHVRQEAEKIRHESRSIRDELRGRKASAGRNGPVAANDDGSETEFEPGLAAD